MSSGARLTLYLVTALAAPAVVAAAPLHEWAQIT